MSNNVDYIITMNSSLLQDAILRLSIHAADIHFYPVLETEKAVICSLLHSIQQQRGGERFIDDPKVLDHLSDHFPHTKSVGGTAARAANLLAERGVACLLHCISYTEEDSQIIHPLVEVVASNKQKRAPFHCILQYNQDLSVQIDHLQISAKTCDRIILNNNPAISEMKLNPRFFALAHACNMLLISGLNAIHDSEIFKKRLFQIANHLSAYDESMTILYEDGCFHSPNYRTMLIEQLGPYLSIYSMNEEEWYELINTVPTTIEQKKQAIVLAHRILGVPTVIIHTRSFVVAYGSKAQSFGSALQAGVNLATCHLIGKETIFDELQLCNEGLVMQRLCTEKEFCCIPSYNVKSPNLTTIGLGDAFIAGFLLRGVSEYDQKRVC